MTQNDAQQSEQIGTALTGNAALPVCYKSLTPLSAQQHRDLRYARPDGFQFARGVSVVPALAGEFMPAQHSYPIVFTQGDRPQPTFLLAARRGQNDFVDDHGNWQPGAHVPSFLRRYPFMLVRENEGSSRFVLCSDLTAEGFSDVDGDLLFEADEHSAVLERVLKFCRWYQQAQRDTQALVSELLDHDLLRKTAIAADVDGQTHRIDGFQTVSEERFKALPDAKLAGLARRGIVGLLSAHWSSLQAFRNIGLGAAT